MNFKSFFASAVVVSAMTAPAMAQVTSVSQLRDVQPTDWSYQAVSNLVSRYGCVAGFPNGTFQPGQPATRAQLAALTSACLDRISEYQTAADAALAAALRAQFSKEIAATNTRVTTLEVASARKAQGVGQYVGVGVLLNKQGVAGGGNGTNQTISGATVQARLPVATAWGNEVSIRPYGNFVGNPAGQIGAAGGALATYDYSVSRKNLANGTKVSRANIYGGIGVQTPFVNNTTSNYQSAVGSQTQVVLALGVEGRITDSLVGFADLKFPTTNAGNSYGSSNGTYSPVFTTGLGIKF
jgi:hypothetical protein